MRLALGLLTAILASGTAAAADRPPTMTLAEADKLSDEALTRHVLGLFDRMPELVATRRGGFAALAADTVQIERPAGYAAPGGFPVGFDALTLILRARPTAVSATLCEQPYVTLRLDPVTPIDIARPVPPSRPTSVKEGRMFVPLAPSDSLGAAALSDPKAKPVTHCADLGSNTGAIDAVDAGTAWAGLQLFAQAKRMTEGGAPPQLSCVADEEEPPPVGACRQTLIDALAKQIFRIEACEEMDGDTDDGEVMDMPRAPPGERCLVVSGVRHRTMTSGDGWRAYIVYRPGARRVVSTVRMVSWAYVV